MNKNKVEPIKISPEYIEIGRLWLMSDENRKSLIETGHLISCENKNKCKCYKERKN